jgi:uncharacterized protein with beta-barrel porin domain
MNTDRRISTIARLGASTLALGTLLAGAPAWAACSTVGGVFTCDTTSPNPDSVAANVTAATVTVDTGATLDLNGGAAITSTAATTIITNSGTITGTSGRAINIGNPDNSRTITITNNAGATIKGASDDAVRINFAPTGGTITVNNSGLIQTTNGGQAIDFDGISTSSAQVIINNFAGGEIRSYAADAVRPGQGATVNNSGLIRSDGPTGDNSDGVDWQARSGTVNNLAGGTISGLRHGVNGGTPAVFTVVNGGTILGRNGSGVGSDGTGISVTNTGTIRGTWDGVQANGDGDGVDIDGIGTVVNSGTIEGLTAAGVDSGGRPNSAQGVAMGGGSITNNAGGLISGGAQGVLINLDTNPGGAAVGATTILNAGTIRGVSAEGIQLVGNFADGITTSGAIIGGNGKAIDMGGGDDSLTVTGAASFTGSIDGGAGIDTLTLGTTTTNTIDNVANFESLVVTGSGWRLGSSATFANGVTIGAGGGLTGNSATLIGPIANSGTLTVDQTTAGTFAAALTGTGSLVKTGGGDLTIGNLPGFTGPTTVNQGKLILAGVLPGAIAVQNGATLAGNGTVGTTTLQAGATIAPGNSIGTIIVNGNFTAASGSTYIAETAATGAADRIAISGTATIAPGANLQIVRDGGTYAIGQRYTVLTATGGVSGGYTLQQVANPLTEFRLGGTASSVFVDVARTATALTATGVTPNQIATAAGLGSVGVLNAAYAALTLIPEDATVRAGLTGLSGEIHGTVFTALLDDAAAVQNAARTRLLDGAQGPSVWATGLRRWGTNKGGFTQNVFSEAWGVVGGIDTGLGEAIRVGVAGGQTWTDLTTNNGIGSARAETTHVLGYVGGNWNGLRLNLTAGYAWSDVTTRRSVTFFGFADSLSAAYKARTIHGGADLGYQIALGGGSVEPFAAVEVYKVRRDAFTEAGGGAALSGLRDEESNTISTLGARFSTPISGGLSARGQLGWRHAFGDLVPVSSQRFAGGAAFGIQGAPLNEDAAAAEIALRYAVGNVALTGSYNGIIGKNGDDSRFQLGLSIGF